MRSGHAAVVTVAVSVAHPAGPVGAFQVPHKTGASGGGRSRDGTAGPEAASVPTAAALHCYSC